MVTNDQLDYGSGIASALCKYEPKNSMLLPWGPFY